MSEPRYRKVMIGKRTTYQLVEEEESQNVKIDMNDKEIVTLATAVATCIMMGLEKHLQPHKALSQRIRACETAISKLAQLSASSLDENMRGLGIQAWGAAMQYIGEHINEKST